MANKQLLSRAGKYELLKGKLSYLNTLRLRASTFSGPLLDTTPLATLVEPSDGGYAEIVAPLGFELPVRLVGGEYQTSARRHRWAFLHDDGDFTVYIVYLYDPAQNDWISGQVLDTPFVCTATGQSLNVTPVVQEDTLA